jgi:hypothetical protein
VEDDEEDFARARIQVYDFTPTVHARSATIVDLTSRRASFSEFSQGVGGAGGVGTRSDRSRNRSRQSSRQHSRRASFSGFSQSANGFKGYGNGSISDIYGGIHDSRTSISISALPVLEPPRTQRVNISPGPSEYPRSENGKGTTAVGGFSFSDLKRMHHEAYVELKERFLNKA